MDATQTRRSNDELAAAFADERQRLRGIAYRMLGSYWDAEDAVQETWVRLQRADPTGIDNLAAWLTTVVSRVAIDALRSRGARHEADEAELPDASSTIGRSDPEDDALLADEVGSAMLVVLDTLGPLERLAFVLHDVFGMPFDDIAPIVERTPAATRQLASRARRRLGDAQAPAEHARRREAVAAFIKASREGDFASLLQLLDPDVELRADDIVVQTARGHAAQGAPLLEPRVRGADAVARVFAGRARDGQVALVDGLPGVVYAPAGETQIAFLIQLHDGRVTSIEVIGDPARVADLSIEL